MELIYTFDSPNNKIDYIFFTKNNEYLVTISDPKRCTVMFWEIKNNYKLIFKDDFFYDGVDSFAINPNGNLIAIAGGGYGFISLIDISSKEKFILGSSKNNNSDYIQSVRGMCFSKNGKYLISTCDDGSESSISIWDLDNISNNRPIKIFYSNEIIYSLKPLPNNKIKSLGKFILIEEEKMIYLYNFIENIKIKLINNDNKIISNFNISENSNLISIVFKDKNTFILNVFELIIKNNNSIFMNIIFSKNFDSYCYSYFSFDSKLLVVNQENSILVFDLLKKRLIYSLNNILKYYDKTYHSELVSSLDKNNMHIAYSNDFSYFCIFDLKNNIKVKELYKHSNFIYSLLFINNKSFLSGGQYEVILWDIEKLTVKHLFNVNGYNIIYNKYNHIFASNNDENIFIFDLETYKNTLEINTNYKIEKILFIPNENLILSFSKNIITLWDLKTSCKALEYKIFDNKIINDLIYIQKEYSIIYIENNQSLIKLNLKNLKELLRINIKDKLLRIELEKENNNKFACIFENNIIKVFNINLQEINTLKLENKITDIKFLNGNYLIISQEKSIVTFWNLKNLEKKEFFLHGNIEKIDINHNSKLLLTAGGCSANTEIKLWSY